MLKRFNRGDGRGECWICELKLCGFDRKKPVWLIRCSSAALATNVGSSNLVWTSLGVLGTATKPWLELREGVVSGLGDTDIGCDSLRAVETSSS